MENRNSKKSKKKGYSSFKKINGKLIEVPFSKNISSSEIKDKIIKLSSPNNRVSKLKRLMSAKNSKNFRVSQCSYRLDN